MGTCQSTGENIARSLEERCGSSSAARRQHQHRKRRRRAGEDSSSCSSSSSPIKEAPRELALRDLGANHHAASSRPAHEQHGCVPGEGENTEPSREKDETTQPKEAEEEDAKSKLARLKEGVDFIETEEDAKAVEAATLKIQSTFRGKKIRSKLGGGGSAPAATAASATSAAATGSAGTNIGATAKKEAVSSKDNNNSSTSTKNDNDDAEAACELSKKVAEMQVNDKTDQLDEGGPSSTTGLPEEEAERAATKIQAGFKGYKTRKELEGKLPSQGAGAPAGGGGSEAPNSEAGRQEAGQS